MDQAEETETEPEDVETETETEPDQPEEEVRLSPSNAYLEVSFEHQPATLSQNTAESIYSTPKRITKDDVVSSTPNNKVRTITQV